MKGGTTSSISRFLATTFELLNRISNKLSLLIIIGCFAAIFILRAYLLFVYQSDLGGVESNVIYSILRVLGGYPLYQDPELPPYSITQYSPLYYYTIVNICRLFGLEPENLYAVYIVNRSFSLASNLFFAFIVSFTLRHIFNVRWAIQLIAGIFSFIYLEVESFARPDSLYNASALFTIFLFLSYLHKRQNTPKRWVLVLAAIFSVITIFVKQSGIYLPLLIILYLTFFTSSRKELAISVGAIIVSFIALIYFTKGAELTIFFKNVVGGVNNGVSYSWWIMRMLELHLQRESIFDIAGLFLGGWYLVKYQEHEYRFLGLSLLTTFVFANLTGLKIGSAPNYFTEFLAVSFIAIGVFINQHKAWIQKLTLPYLPVVGLLLVTFTVGIRTLFLLNEFPKFSSITYESYLQNLEIKEYLEDNGLHSGDLVFTTTHRYDFLNKILYENSAFPQKEIVLVNPEDTFDYTDFRKSVANGKVKFFIERKDGSYEDPGISEQFLGVDFHSFIPIKEMHGYSIYKNPTSP